ncbi:polyribonucleotide nucleotidyltransferase [Patescibacteria group bacterium]|nr:polyribonucleotide nucleotidyltransferase [Patescibacteria group bacterium]
MVKIEEEFAGEKISIETGKIATKSSGAVWFSYGENIVLVTSVISSKICDEIDFVPLTVDYREKAYAAGKIPGGFFKREGKPSDGEVLSSRLIDRSIRPLFPQGFRNETQVIATVLSASESNQPPLLGITGASLALFLFGKSFSKLVAGVRIGRINGEFVINPTDKELKISDLNLVISGDKEGIIMVEGEAGKIEESVIMEALKRAHLSIKKLIEIEEKFTSLVSLEKKEISLCQVEEEIKEKVENFAKDKIWMIQSNWNQEKKNNYLEKIKEETLRKFLSHYPEREKDVLSILAELGKKKMREMVILDGERWDGRGADKVRPISCEVGILPRVHGSGLFTRGETQSLVVATLGTSTDEQRVNGLQKDEITKRFMFHYNFLPFSTGEVRFLRFPGRREIGHGFLAERALSPILPDNQSFPYTIRLVSDILESNGSSSMASVCGGSLCLMDAGVPISDGVAGVAMGLIKEGDKAVILTDIQGIEDHLGDMDFKIAGTREAITALQLDIKISGIDFNTLEETLIKAKKARCFMLDKMEEVIGKPREKLSTHAPRIATVPVPLDKIGGIIGPGGRIIKKIIQETGAQIDIDDEEGKVIVSSDSEEATEKALQIVKGIIAGPKVGQIYLGKVKRVTDFGAFVEISPGKEGLVHVSELSDKFVKDVSDIVKVGDEVLVKLIGVDQLGRLNLSRRKAQDEK